MKPEDPGRNDAELGLSKLTIVTSIVEALLSWLGHGGASHGAVHASWCSDIWRRAEASRCSLPLLLLHQHHHPLPPHLHGHHLPAALSHHLGIQETRLQTKINILTIILQMVT